ncbi:hypothetical protein, partial [Prevotella pallens]
KNSGVKQTVVLEEGTVTDIETPSVSTENDDNSWFNMQGIKLNGKPNKGIYIHNGKKQVVR